MTPDDIAEWLRRSDGRIEDIFGLWVQGKRDGRWVGERLIEEGHLAALPPSEPDATEGRRSVTVEAEMCAYGFTADGTPRDGKPVEHVRLIEPFYTPPAEGSNYGDRGYIVARDNGVLVWATEGSLRVAALPPSEPEAPGLSDSPKSL